MRQTPQMEISPVLSAFSKAFSQLPDPRFRRIIMISVVMTITVYLVLCAVLAGVMFGTDLLQGLPFWETVIDWAAIIVVPIAALLFFPVVISSFIGMFLDEVVSAVEDKHYPGLLVPRPQGIGEVLFGTMRLLALALILNLVLFPFYLLFPLVGQIGFFLVNGYLIGWEYFELVALRRLSSRDVKRLRGAYSGKLLFAGALTTLMLTIPFLNLIAPVIGAAAMVHLAHGLPNQPLRTTTVGV
jgi:uncharacterized protein involved in cysteine biosynthesis